MIERRWIVRCDQEGCGEVLVIPLPDMGGPDDKWSAGAFVEDSGWDAMPSRRETYCPRHAALAATTPEATGRDGGTS